MNNETTKKVCCAASAVLLTGAIGSGAAMLCSMNDLEKVDSVVQEKFNEIKETKNYQDWIIAREQELYTAYKNDLLDVTEFNSKMKYLRSFEHFMRAKENIVDVDIAKEFDEYQNQLQKLNNVSAITGLALIGTTIGSIAAGVSSVVASEKQKEEKQIEEMFWDD